MLVVEGYCPYNQPQFNSPLHLLGVFLLSSLCLHLLYLNGVRLAAAQIQFMVTHAQSKDALVDTQTWGEEDEVLIGEKETSE